MQNPIYIKKGTGPNLIVLHGWLQNKESWGQTAEELPKYFTCWFLDFPQFGNNTSSLHNKGPLGYSEWLDEFIDKNKIKSCFVVGHSFGGRVAAISATHNRSIKKLILYCSPVVSRSTNRTKLTGIARKAGIKNIPFVSNLFRSDDYKNTTNENREIFLKSVNFELKDYLSRINIPTLIMAGEKDTEVSVEVGQAAHRIIKDSEFYVFPSCGHFVHLEKPLLFGAKVKDFLLK